jgi:hypothetical protein
MINVINMCLICIYMCLTCIIMQYENEYLKDKLVKYYDNNNTINVL